MRHQHGKRPRGIKPGSPGSRGKVGGGLGVALAPLGQGLSPPPQTAASLNDQGAMLGSTGRLDQALACFDQALMLDPDHVDALNNRGLLLGMLGRHQEAIISLDRAAHHAPRRFDVLCNRGYSLNEAGRHQEAVDCLDQALKLNPRHFGALNNHGLALAALARYDEAQSSFAAALAIKPDDFGAWLNRGLALDQLGRWQEALACVDQALERVPGHAEALNSRGAILLRLERHEEALACFDRALAASPQHPGLLANRAIALGRLDRYEEALACCDQACRLNPEDFGAHLNRAVALSKLHRNEEALASVDRALELQPGHLDALFNRGSTLFRMHRLEEALSCLRQVLAAEPDHLEALNTCGAVLWAMDRGEEALACYAHVLRLQPDHVNAINNRSFIDLAHGRLQEGFRAQEIRWQTDLLRRSKLQTAAPLWLGDAPLQGKTILLSHEQGFGDTLQFVRYALQLARQAGRVVLAVPAPLRGILQSLPGDFEIVAEGEPLPPHDLHCPMMSLPLACGTTLDTIPAEVPYLFVEPARAAEWAARLGPRRRPRIGLVWAGRQRPPLNIPRDMTLQQVQPLLALAADFISLQKEIPKRDRALLDALPQLARHGESLGDFADTAALIANLDLVITVDTAVAHLAAALGKPVWVMDRYASCWRWLRGREDSPWYPTLRLFRQASLGDWAGVVERVQSAAAQFIAEQAVSVPLPAAEEDAQSLMRHGLAAAEQGDYESALGCFTQVLAGQPRNLDALYNLGATLGMLGYNAEALQCFEQGLAIEPGHPDLLCNRGLVLGRLERFEEAQACFEQVLAVDPRRVEALNGRGLALANRDLHEESLACFEQALALAPRHRGVVLNRGLALGKLHRFEEALVCFWRVLADEPDHIEALLNRGIMLDKLNRRDEALACYERVLELDPEQHEARCDRGLIRLGRGDFKEGFADFESRWDAFLKNARPDTAAPQWRGEPLHGKTVLLHHEQGFGDTLQFVRYAPLIVRRGGRVLLQVPAALHALLRSLRCEVQIVAEGAPLPPHDYHCPMMSLPLAFGATLEDIPAEIPYLYAEPGRAAAWAARLGPKARLRIGLAWAGRQYRPVNYTRDMPLEALLPLLALDADFVSLQNEIPERDRALLDELAELPRHGEAAADFADSAALIAGLDLVITVDTATAHLAAALGKPVWIMSRYAGCWRWLQDREDSPWYPTVRLFRQRAMRDWAGVVEQVHGALQRLIERQGELPGAADPLQAEGRKLAPLQRPAEALERFDRVLAADPQCTEVLMQRGLMLAALERVEEALACFNRVLAVCPDSVEALFNRGLMLDKINRREEALACYDAVLAARPDHAAARCNRGMVLLGAGRYAEGFHDYESRWETGGLLDSRLQLPTPLWLGGSSLDGKTILVHHEQGYGDAIQFARYVPLLAQRARRVILGTPPELQALMRSLPGAAEIIADGDPLPPHDCHCPLLSLPLAFGTRLETVPAAVPYLGAEPARVEVWDRRLGRSGGLRVGLAWAGRQAPRNLPRDVPLELLLPVLELRADFVSLQKEVPIADLATLQDQRSLRRHGESLQDFADAAALVANLDLVITVDTAIAHLAGAMGKPVWLMNRHAACWRWLRERSDSPWYPSLRQFRQATLGDWCGVVREVREALVLLLDRREAAA